METSTSRCCCNRHEIVWKRKCWLSGFCDHVTIWPRDFRWDLFGRAWSSKKASPSMGRCALEDAVRHLAHRAQYLQISHQCSLLTSEPSINCQLWASAHVSNLSFLLWILTGKYGVFVTYRGLAYAVLFVLFLCSQCCLQRQIQL